MDKTDNVDIYVRAKFKCLICEVLNKKYDAVNATCYLTRCISTKMYFSFLQLLCKLDGISASGMSILPQCPYGGLHTILPKHRIPAISMVSLWLASP